MSRLRACKAGWRMAIGQPQDRTCSPGTRCLITVRFMSDNTDEAESPLDTTMRFRNLLTACDRRLQNG